MHHPQPSLQSAAFVRIDITNQRLTLAEAGHLVRAYPVSTGAKGHGCEAGSYQTPTGLHRIKLKVGEGQPLGAENHSSQRTLEKAGFAREGRMERYMIHPNISAEPRACFMYSRCRCA